MSWLWRNNSTENKIIINENNKNIITDINNENKNYILDFYNQINLLQINDNTKENIINYMNINNNKINKNITVNELKKYIEDLYYSYNIIEDIVKFRMNYDKKKLFNKNNEINNEENYLKYVIECYDYFIKVNMSLNNEEVYLLDNLINKNKFKKNNLLDIELILKNRKFLNKIYGKLLFHINDNQDILNILNEFYETKFNILEMKNYIISLYFEKLLFHINDNQDILNILNEFYKTNFNILEMKNYIISLYSDKNNINDINDIKKFKNKNKLYRTYNNMYDSKLIYQSPCVMNVYYNKLNTYNCHIGQLKLFYSLFEYLTYIKINSIKHNENYLNESLIVYIGSAPGNNIYTNLQYFKKTTWLLYDPNDFDPRLIENSRIDYEYGIYTYVNKINDNDIFIKTKFSDNKTNGYFGLDKIDEIILFKQNLKKKHIIFISDIRISTNEYNIMKDNELCMRAILQLKPISYQLKFRVPYYGNNYDYKYILNKNLTNEEKLNLTNKELLNENNDNENYLYLDGKIYYQLYSQLQSAEMRLTYFNKNLKYKLKKYNKKEIESNLFYFNVSRNFFIYKNLNNIKYKKIIYYALKNKYIKIFKPIYENIVELIIIYKYLKYNNINNFNNIKKMINKYNIIKQLIIDIYHNISSYDNKQNDKNFIMNRRLNCINNIYNKIKKLY